MSDGTLVYSYADAPTIARFSDAYDLDVRGLMGPFGSGKSAGCVMELVKMGERQRPGPDGVRRSRFGVIRNTYPQLKATTMRTVEQWLPAGAFGTMHITDHRYVIDRLAPDLHIELLYLALDRPDHVSNLLSMELTGAWVNEAREVPWTIIQALIGRVGRYPGVVQGGCVAPGIIMDTNPPDDDSWWYKQFEELRTPGWKLFRQPAGRAPDAENVANLPPGYYERMAASNDADFIRVYVDAEYGYVKEGKPVYPGYNDRVHCEALEVNTLATDRTYLGWDFGLTPACVMAQVLPDGRFLVFDELTADSLGIESFGKQVLEHLAQNYPWLDHRKVDSIADPAGNQRSANAEENKTCHSILRAMGFKVLDGIQTLELRLGSVKHVLNALVDGRPRFALHPRCKTLRKGFQGRYQYREMRIASVERRYHDEPDKNSFSHPHDALQYIAAKLFGNLVKGRIESHNRKKIEYPNMGIV